MPWSKRQFVTQAFEEIGIASYVYDLHPEQLDSGLRKLDAMMATWNAKGIRLGYPIPSTPDASSLDQDTGVPDAANEAIYANLAIRLGGAIGKTPSPYLIATARAGYDALCARAAFPAERQLPADVPLGAGNRNRTESPSPFTRTPEQPLQAGKDSAIEFD